MLPEELSVFARHYSTARRIVEFGAGGSTFFAAAETAAEICSVESDPAWIEKLRSLPEIAAAESEGRLRLIHSDIGPTGELGYPADHSARDRWRFYPEAPWSFMKNPDLVFIDGRFRSACILTTILRTHPRTRIMIHDFWNRPAYHVALPFVKPLERVETLGVFRARWFISRHKLETARRGCIYDPA